MGKHYKKQSTKKYVIFIIHFIFWIILIYSAFQIIKWYIHNKQNEELMEEISKAIIVEQKKEKVEKEDIENVEETYKIDFNALKEVNSDTVGFLKVNGTEIKYPIVKTTDNDYYLNHSFDKKYNSAGWIFADYRNNIDESDKNIIIYGHNRKNGTMFSSLQNILNKKWFTNKENLKMQLITPNQEFEYEVFSAYQIEKETYYLQTEFSNNEEYLKFINILKNRSIIDFGIDVTFEDQILTLSTCANDKDYRVVLHAKRVD